MTKYIFYIFLLEMTFFQSCQNLSPRPTSWVGTYRVTLQLSQSSKEETSDLNNEFEDEPKKRWQNNENQQSQSNQSIDTSTLGGKIDYATDQFEKSMENLGDEIQNVAKDLDRVFEKLAQKGNSIKNGLLDDFTFKVTLQDDGDIKIVDWPIDFINVNNAFWQIEKDQFVVKKDEKILYSFTIIKKDKNKIVLENKDIILHAEKLP
ncbi:MAG: hypothetical protein WAT79_17325 [Saprospiraceae bacterium]